MAHLLGRFCCIYYNRIFLRIYRLLVPSVLAIQGITLEMSLKANTNERENLESHEFVAVYILCVVDGTH